MLAPSRDPAAKLERENRALRETIDELTETIRQMKEAATNGERPGILLWPQLDLTRAQRRLLALLYERSPRLVTGEDFFAALHGGAPRCQGLMRVHLHRLRKQLARVDVTISNVHGEGVRIDAENREKLRALVVIA